MRRSVLRDESGMAMMVVIMALLVVALLSTAAVVMASSNMKNGLVEREFQASYYVAEAGATYYMEDLRNDIIDIYNTTTTSDQFFTTLESSRVLTTMYLGAGYFQPEYGYQPEAEVILTRLDMSETNPRTYAVVSQGVTDDVSRKVLKKVTVNWSPRIDLGNLMSVFCLGQITINQGTIDGPIGTNLVSNSAINITGWPNIDDYNLLSSAQISSTNAQWLISGPRGSRLGLPAARSYPLPNFPVFPQVSDCEVKPAIYRHGGDPLAEYTLTSPITYIPSITIDNDRKIRIKFNSRNNKLLVGDINIPQGTMYLEGSGTLELYVLNNITLGGGAIINPPASYSEADMRAAAERLAISLKGTVDPATNKVLTLGNDVELFGSVFAEDADIKILNGAKAVGNIITGGKNVEISGGTDVTTQVIYAPNANVRMSGSGTVFGPVISNTFYMEGGAKVEYDPSIGIISDPFLTVTEEDLIPVEGPVREQ